MILYQDKCIVCGNMVFWSNGAGRFSKILRNDLKCARHAKKGDDVYSMERLVME